MADLARAQHAVATTLGPFADLEQSAVDQAIATRTPPLAVDTHQRDPAWRDGLVKLLAYFDDKTLPLPAAAAIANLRDRGPASVEALADSFLNGDMAGSDAGAALYIAASLQVYFTRLAAGPRRAVLTTSTEARVMSLLRLDTGLGRGDGDGPDARNALFVLLALLDGVESRAGRLHYLRGFAHALLTGNRRRFRCHQG